MNATQSIQQKAQSQLLAKEIAKELTKGYMKLLSNNLKKSC